MLQELEDVVGSGWSLYLINSMAECWEIKAPVSTLSSSFFPSFLAPKRNHPTDAMGCFHRYLCGCVDVEGTVLLGAVG